VKGNQIKVGGIPVGSVKSIELTRDNHADVEVSLTDSDFDPLHVGTRAWIRVNSLSSVANRFIALEPGPNNAAKIPDGGSIAADDTQSPVEIDALQAALDADTRHDLQRLIHGGAEIYSAGGAAGLNKGLRNLSPALSQLEGLTNELARDRPAFERFLVSAAGVATAVSDRNDDFRTGLGNAAVTAKALARERSSLASLLAEAPATLRQGTGTLRRLTPTLNALVPVAEDLGPTAPRLNEALVRLSPVLSRARPVVGKANELLPALRGALVELPKLKRTAVPALRAASSTIKEANPVVNGLLPYLPDVLLGPTTGFGGTAGGYYDANGSYARIGFVGGAVSGAGLGSLITSGRVDSKNTNRCPGAGTQPDAGRSNVFLPPGVSCDQGQRP
jgi:phospholipid/cholesterol/gamma-HCH transport system substrate-binding protein